jgi:hypothetical protein
MLPRRAQPLAPAVTAESTSPDNSIRAFTAAAFVARLARPCFWGLGLCQVYDARARQLMETQHQAIDICGLVIQMTRRSNSRRHSKPLQQLRRGEIARSNGDATGIEVPQYYMGGMLLQQK